MARIHEEIKDSGVLVGVGGAHHNVFRIQPPLCIDKQDVDFTIEVLGEIFERHTKLTGDVGEDKSDSKCKK